MRTRLFVGVLVTVLAAACGREQEEAKLPTPITLPERAAPGAANVTLDRGLLLAISPFEVTPEGEVLPRPGAARLEMLRLRNGVWEVSTLDDADSNVFHKAMVYEPPGGAGILTLGGTKAALRLRRTDGSTETLWEQDFGGRFSRMRDAEVADLYGDGVPTLAVATHDQGVVATVKPGASGWEVSEIDHEKDTFVHEIEVGDLDGDGVLEVYATPSEPNRLDGTPQPGKVTRYVPARAEGRTVVADLGNRHAKEILVDDVDGDGTDELYVSVEGETEGKGRDARLLQPVEILRYDADTPAEAGIRIARIEGEQQCRFLTAGDVDGDGRKEMVAAAFKSGLWLLRPGSARRAAWTVSSIDRGSSGFEHAAILTDLDADRRDELYVASDDHAELRRYVWNGSRFDRATIYERKVNGRKVPGSAFTWNIMPAPVSLFPSR